MNENMNVPASFNHWKNIPFCHTGYLDVFLNNLFLLLQPPDVAIATANSVWSMSSSDVISEVEMTANFQ
jgi:hypothetical protein